MSDPYVDTAELARRWKLSPGHIANLRVKRQGPPFVKIGKRVLYSVKDVEAYEAENRR